MKIILAGGGTGGHVIPALAIAEELRRSGHDAAFVGTARGIETRLVPKAQFPLYLVKVGALNRVSLATRLRTLIDLPLSIFAAVRILRAFHAQAVIGVGGYAAGPATIAAVLLRIPVVLFEPNVVPGYANRAVARFAAKAAVHFAQTGRWFRRYGVSVEVTGVPVRPAFFALPVRRSPHPTLLLFGGSQGARALNRILRDSAAELLQRIPNLRIVHQTGSRELDEVSNFYAERHLTVEVSAFLDDMPQRFADADLIVCRSGASTVAEVAAAGKCALFVPFPGAADDHQLRNAELLAQADAALLIPESELSPERFVNEVTALLSSPERLAAMSAKARALAHPDAAAHIAAMALSAANRS